LAGDTPGTATGSNYNYLQTGNLERGLSYNPITGHLILVSRSTAGNGIRILDGASGADIGALNQGSGIIAGGTFTTNLVDVAADGALYVANLSTSASTNFKVYRWGTEGDAAPTVAYDAPSGVNRTGDAFAVGGGGVGTKMAAAGSATTDRSNFVALSTADGWSYTSTAYLNVPGTTTTSNDYRLGLTFVDADTIIGTQGGSARMTDFGASATVAASIPLGATQRPLDYAVIGGRPILAIIDSAAPNLAKLSVYDISAPASPLLLASGNLTSGSLTTNPNGTGSVAIGNVTATGATIYAMNTNNGIQAFTLSGVPEPATATILAIGAIGMGVVRRRGVRSTVGR
jgi:hypothetical protein